jgi:vitamin B12 transporter
MSHATRALLASASLIALSPTITYAADTTEPTVVVTAARSETPINEIASSMTVITADDIARENRPTVTELLRDVPGITVANTGGVGQSTRIFMRGTNSNHVLVLIDGVRVNDPSDPGDAFDFSNLTTDNIERIEVLRGPQSTLYGSQAIGGVINIITKQGKGAPSYSGFAEYGRYNSRREGVGSSGEIGRTSYSVTASEGHTDGISSYDKRLGGHEKDGNDTYTLSANTATRLTDNFVAKLTARYNRADTQFDSPGSFTRPSDDPNPRNDSRQLNARAAGELSLLDGKWVQELGLSTLNVHRDQLTVYYDPLGNELFGRQYQSGWRQTVDWVHHIKLIPDNVVTFGGEAYSDHFKTISSSEVNVDNKALFIDDQFTPGKNFFVNGSMRVDDNQAFGNQFTWKVAPGYHILSTGTTLKSSYGTGFKAPSLAQLYDPSSGNPLLNPEKSKGWDAGFEQSLWADKLVFGSTFFRNDILQLINFSNSPPYGAINLGKARTEGVENVVTLRPWKDWRFNGSYTYTLSENRASDVELARRPRHMGDLGAVYQYSALGDVGADIRYTSSRRDIDINPPYGSVYVKSFTTLDLVTNYAVTPTVTAYARLDNVLDKHYEEVYAYSQPGMALYAGLKAKF